MRKRKIKKTAAFILMVVLTVLCLGTFLPKRTDAASLSIYADKEVVYIGDTVTVYVTLYSDEIYAYFGYIGCDDILSGTNDSFIGTPDGESSISFSYTYRAVSEGEGGIYISDCEVSNGSSKDYCDGACYITVLGYDDGGGGTGGNAGGVDYNDDYSIDGGYINGKETGEGSGNCNLASLTVEGYELKDEGHDIYSIFVGGTTEKINILAAAEDEKATITGDGEQILKPGENVFEVIVTAENGLSKTYTIKVTRRGVAIGLSDLLTWLSDSDNTEDSVTIKLKEGDILTPDMISALGKWGKIVYLNQYDKDEKFVYGWTLESKNFTSAKDFKEFDPAVSFKTENEEKINEASNYAICKYLNFAYSGGLPEGTLFNLSVDEDFKDTDKVQLYYFNPKSTALELKEEGLTVEKGIVKFSLSHCSDYILTKAKIAGIIKEEKSNKNQTEKILLVVAAVIIVGLAVALILVLNKTKKNKKGKNNKKDNSDQGEFPVIQVEDLELDEDEIL